MDFPKFDFGTLRYRHHEGEGVYTESYGGVSESSFAEGLEKIIREGFEVKQSYDLGPLTFRALAKDEAAIFISFFAKARAMATSRWLWLRLALKGSAPCRKSLLA